MKLSRRVYKVFFLFVIVAVISITAYVKSPYIFKKNEVQPSTTLTVNKSTQHLEAQQRLETQNKLEERKFQKEEKLQKTSSKNQTSSIKLTHPITPRTKPNLGLLIDRIKVKENVQQAIFVTTNGFGTVNATITTFEYVDGEWKQVASFAGNIGRKGFTYNKVEGDEYSPIGIFSLGTALGRYSNPGTEMNYKQSTLNDFWVNDVNSPLYNTWQEGPANKRWDSAENMYIPQYNYGFVINYNTTKRIPGKGSAIFFHVWSGPGHGTEGCTATAQDNVISILRWLKPSKNPVIIEGPMSEVVKM